MQASWVIFNSTQYTFLREPWTYKNLVFYIFWKTNIILGIEYEVSDDCTHKTLILESQNIQAK